MNRPAFFQPDTYSIPPVMVFVGGTSFCDSQSITAKAAESSGLPTSTLVAIHANRGVIRIAAHTLMAIIRIRLVRVRRISVMAGTDAGEDRVIRGIDVAIGANRTVVRNPEPGVVENRASPSGGHVRGVAGNAAGRIVSSHVIWYARSIRLCVCVIALMAAVAVGAGIARGVVAADVAVRAGIHHRSDRAGNRGARRQHVRTLQREPGG